MAKDSPAQAGTDPKDSPAQADTVHTSTVARVRSRVGSMIHLHTGQVVDETDRKMELDSFTLTQIDAGKWEVVVD